MRMTMDREEDRIRKPTVTITPCLSPTPKSHTKPITVIHLWQQQLFPVECFWIWYTSIVSGEGSEAVKGLVE